MSTVLLVESDSIMEADVSSILTQASYRVIHESAVAEATARASQVLPDCILIGSLDDPARLGGLLEALRRNPMTAASPILYLPAPNSNGFQSWLQELPVLIEQHRPSWQPSPEGPDLSILPRSVRDALSELLGEGHRLTLAARFQSKDASFALGEAVCEAARLMERMGTAIISQPEPGDSADFESELSIPLAASLQATASRIGRRFALLLTIAPCTFSGDPNPLIESVAAAVRTMLRESSVAVSLQPEESTIRIDLLARELRLAPEELNQIGLAHRSTDFKVPNNNAGRFAPLLHEVLGSGGTISVAAGRKAGIRMRIHVPQPVAAQEAAL